MQQSIENGENENKGYQLGDIDQEEDEYVKKEDLKKSEAYINFISDKPKKRRLSSSMVSNGDNNIKKDNNMEI